MGERDWKHVEHLLLQYPITMEFWDLHICHANTSRVVILNWSLCQKKVVQEKRNLEHMAQSCWWWGEAYNCTSEVKSFQLNMYFLTVESVYFGLWEIWQRIYACFMGNMTGFMHVFKYSIISKQWKRKRRKTRMQLRFIPCKNTI